MSDYRGYKFCGDIFCLYKIEWIKLPIILDMFPKLHTIEIYSIQLSKKIFDYLLIIIVTKINQIISDHPEMKREKAMKLLTLQYITIDEPFQDLLSMKKAVKKYKNKFRKIGWIMYEEDEQLILTSDEE